MPKFSKKSQAKLDTCHSDLIRLFEIVVKYFDCTILEGHRGEAKQNLYYYSRPQKSKVKWPDGKHNKIPSQAVDAVPYPVNWGESDIVRFYYFGGFVKGIATAMDIPIRWGGDWNDDTQTADERFKDLVHFELLKED